MNKSTITKLNNQFNIVIDAPTVQYFSGNSYRVAFEAYTDGNNTIYVIVKTKETIAQAVERTIQTSIENQLLRVIRSCQLSIDPILLSSTVNLRSPTKQLSADFICDSKGSVPCTHSIGREGLLDDTKPVQLSSAKAKEIAEAAEANNPTKLHKESFEGNKHKF